MSLGVGAVVAGAGGRQLEGLDGEGEVLVIGVVGEEAVVDALLQALGLVAGGHQGARLSGGVALLNPKYFQYYTSIISYKMKLIILS